MANQYRHNFTRHKHTQNLLLQHHPRKTGTRSHGCRNPKCGCGLYGKKRHKIQLWLWNWLQQSIAWSFDKKEPKILRNARHWNRKYARTRWLAKIKHVYE